MRKGFLALLFLSICGMATATNADQDLKLIRKQLVHAITDAHTADSLYHALEITPAKTPLTTAYMGALDALKAKHAWNPYSKIKFLNNSEKLMSLAVDRDPHNIEIRFMRFSIQHNVPSFLGYAKNLDNDKQEMIADISRKNYGTADRELTVNIIRFLIDSKRCSRNENDNLYKQLAILK